MKYPHFFKIHSRLGMMHAPYHSHVPNVGVESGPDAVLNESFLEGYKRASVDSFSFSQPEKVSDNEYYPTLAKESLRCAEFINTHLGEKEEPVIIGGDHSIGFASLLALLKRKDVIDVGYIQFDSHGDINSIETSPSGNFHGMWLRPFVGSFEKHELTSLIEQKLPPAHMMYIGNVEFDHGEKEYVDDQGILVMGRERLKTGMSHIQHFLSSFTHIHVSFDIDVFSRHYAKATGTPAVDGLEPDEVFPVLKLIKKHPSISLDLVEVNPKKWGAEKTVLLAQEVLKKLV